MVTSMAVSNHDLLRFKRQDRAHSPSSAVLNDHTHLRCHRRVYRFTVPRSIKVDRFGENAVTHDSNAM